MNGIKEIKEQFNLTGKLVVTYDGSNDEGYVNEIELGKEAARNAIETWVYGELASRFGGWEINEGSQGTISIDFDTGKVQFSHSENVIETIDTNLDETF